MYRQNSPNPLFCIFPPQKHTHPNISHLQLENHSHTNTLFFLYSSYRVYIRMYVLVHGPSYVYPYTYKSPVWHILFLFFLACIYCIRYTCRQHKTKNPCDFSYNCNRECFRYVFCVYLVYTTDVNVSASSKRELKRKRYTKNKMSWNMEYGRNFCQYIKL